MCFKNHAFALFFNLYRSQIGMEVKILITREPLKELHENVALRTNIAEKILKRNFSEIIVSVCFVDAQL